MPATETLTLRVPPDLARAVRARAKREGVSVNAYGTEALRQIVERDRRKSERAKDRDADVQV